MTWARHARWLRALLSVLLALTLVAPARAQQATFSNEQLDQMLAPIALYPDSLLSQVLMASTYPADVAQAVQWSKANAGQKGDAAVKAVEGKGWDPSVASLAAFPEVLALMGEKPEWVQSVGDAFLAHPEAVMDSVQRLRAAAQKAGNLKTSEQQKVIIEEAPQTQQTIIKIEPVSPQVVYVPVYNPTVVYGVWPYPAYPPYYWPTPGYMFGTALMTGIAFGAGIAITNALWGGCNWGHGDVDINVNRYNNINVNNKIDVNQNNVKWDHKPENRKGVPYRDAGSREKFGKQVAGADQRNDFRGKDVQREKAQATLKDRGADPAAGREALQRDPQARDQAQAAARATGSGKPELPTAKDGDRGKPQLPTAKDGDRERERAEAQRRDRDGAQQSAKQRPSDDAFKGAGDAARTRQEVDRGGASRQSMQQHAKPMPTGGGGGGGAGRARAGGGGGAKRAR